MTPKNRIIEGKNWIKGGEGGSKMTQKNRTSFMNDPYVYDIKRSENHFVKLLDKIPGNVLIYL